VANPERFSGGRRKPSKKAFAKQKRLVGAAKTFPRFQDEENQSRLFCFFFGQCKKEKSNTTFFPFPLMKRKPKIQTS
jgi:hypothetical protein